MKTTPDYFLQWLCLNYEKYFETKVYPRILINWSLVQKNSCTNLNVVFSPKILKKIEYNHVCNNETLLIRNTERIKSF